MLLHIRDKVAPGISYGKDEVKHGRKYNIGLSIFFVLNLIISLIVVSSKNESAFASLTILNLLTILFFIYMRNKGKNIRK